MKDFKSQKIKTALKQLLKLKKITYEEVAEQLECSVPTVKRVLGPEELTLNRLLQFCDILDVDLGELEAMTKDAPAVHERFSEAQEIFLSKHQAHFAYLLKLYSGESPKQIAEKYGLTARSTDKYLIALEKHELIRVTGRQKVKPAYATLPGLQNGPLAKVYTENFIRSGTNFFLERILEAVHSPKPLNEAARGSKFGMFQMKITPKSFDAWTKELSQSMKEIERISSFEEKTKDDSELMTAVMLDAHTILPHDHLSLQKLDAGLGLIVNL